uniref:RE1-silencing transcription factor n=1 Tax=Lygus hesperus TaxID=30085 RepID=A0A146KPA0_LYGHE
MDILEFVDALEPNLDVIKGNLRKIADIHIAFYRFYIRFASRCEALVFDQKSRDYLEKCIEFLQTKKLTRKAIQQSRGNLMKMLDSLNDLCISLGGDKRMLSKIYTVIDEAVGDETSEDPNKSEADGALDLLKQLKNLLNDPVDDDLSDSRSVTNMDVGPPSPANSSASSSPEHETNSSRGGIEPMTQYLLSDSGMDSYYFNYTKDFKNVAIACKMNNVMSKTSILKENKYSGLDNMVAKMKINVPIWNYNIDRVDTIDTDNVMENMEIFEGNKSVTDAVLYSCPDFLSVGPFEVYLRNKVFVYHCLVNNCNDCMTTSLEYLKLHVKFTHGESEIDWNCSACELINMHSASQRSLDGALDHLAKCHSMKTTYTLSKERLMEINKKIAEDSENVSVCPEIKEKSGDSRENFNLFQCPVPTCEFSTNSLTLAFGHFSSIGNSDQAFRCRYCPYISFSNYDYCDHLVKQHGNAKYKCAYCPYRSVSKTNSVFHQRDIHPNMPHKILGFEPSSGAKYSYDCRGHNSLKHFMCYESCEFSSLIEQKFTSHLLDHGGVTIVCRYCSKFENSDIGELRDHLLLHGVGEYHCLYCKEAFNFILKAERHLHQTHPSQYPFIVVCQDFETRSHSLKGKYNKIQKLDIGSESIIVVALESDRSVSSVEITNSSEAIVIEDIDHCKMQLKYFMKNTYENMPEVAESKCQSPHVIETLDLTQCDDEPRDRADIKPRIRVRNIEQLRSSWLFDDMESDFESCNEMSFEGVPGTSSSFLDAPHQELQSPFNQEPVPEGETSYPMNMLTPAQIKKEVVSGTSNDDGVAEVPQQQETTEPTYNPEIQIKKEKVDGPKSPKKKKKTAPKPPNEVVKVKQESLETQEGELVINEGQNIQSDHTWDENEGNSAAAAIMETDSTPIHDAITTPNTANSDTEMVPVTEGALNNQLESLDTTAPSTSAASSNPASEIMIGQDGQNSNVPILSAASIADMPVDFDCGILQQPEMVDQKISLNPDGTFVTPHLRYNDPRIVDTVIISDGEEDEDLFSSSSPALEPSPRPGPSTPSKSLVQSTSQGTASDFQTNPGGPLIVSTHTALPVEESQLLGTESMGSVMIASTGTLLPADTGASQPPTYLLVEANSANTSVQNMTTVPQPVPETKKYRCKLCQFISDDRQQTYAHLYTSHPNKLSERVRKLKINQSTKAITGDITVKGVSCPYCPDKVYEGVKSFERHHSQEHGDFSEVKCFIIYPANHVHPERVFACTFCGTFCRNEEAVWQHTLAVHTQRLKTMKKPISLRAIVALKKMVCPLYNCLEEFLQPNMFRLHMQSHSTVIACKTCTYIADTIEAFQAFHDELDPVERLTHFFYHKSKEDIANLINVQRFSNPLYSLNSVILDDYTTPKKTVARKSTGAQYNR